MTHDEVVSRVREYIVQNFLYMRRGIEFSDCDSLLERGIIDSVGIVELIVFLQDEFEVAVESREITEDNFGTLESIGRFVVGKCEPKRLSA